MTQYRATLLMTIACVVWGTNPAIIKLIDWPPLALGWVRSVFCITLLLLFLLYRRSFSLRSLNLQLACGFFLALNSVFYVSASLYTTPANAVLLMFIFPWVTLSLDFLIRGKKPLLGDFIRLCLGMLGVFIIVGGGINLDGFSGEQNFGNLLALCSGVVIGLHIFFGQSLQIKYQQNQEVLNAILLGWALSVILLAPFGVSELIKQEAVFQHPAHYWLIAFGLLSAIPWLLWGLSVAYLPGHVSAALLGIEVFAAALFGWWLLSDVPGIETWVGGAFTLLAATLQLLSSMNKNKNEAA